MNRPLATLSIALIGWTMLTVAPPTPATAGTSFGVNRIRYVDATGTAFENCQSLRDTLSAIADNSENNKYLVRLEPGLYHCQNQALVVGEGITLMGSGMHQTRIYGTVDNNLVGVVHLAGSSSGLRDLFVHNGLGSPEQKAIAISVNTLFSSSHLQFVELRDTRVHATDHPLYAIDADIEIWGSQLSSGPVQHDSSTAPTDTAVVFIHYSLFSSVQGTGIHKCRFSGAVAAATEYDSDCQPVP